MKRCFKDVLALLLLCMAGLALIPRATAKEFDADLERLVEKIKKEVKDELEDQIKKELKDELEDRVARLEDLSQVGTLRTCSEYGKYGLQRSGPMMVDPDGALIGEEPFKVFCNFTSGSTEVYHDTEDATEVEHCHDPGCYNKTITYTDGPQYADGDQSPVALSQIVSLIELSEFCLQEILIDCTLAPLNDEDIDYAYWEDRHGQKNVYFTGSNYGNHVCDCNYEEPQCIDEDTKGNRCNCDANLPIPLYDTGTITNMTALPIQRMFFGGLNYDLQFTAFTLGRLKCYGEKDIEVATSCSALKTAGVLKSGYYNVKALDDLRPSLVYCDMTAGTYTDVPQLDQPSEDSPIGTILAWVTKPEENLSVRSSLPEGWLFCNGSTILQGPWAGGQTPNLNVGHFLRGGLEEEMLMFEEDQLLDHDHVDVGHSHSATSSSSPHSHTYKEIHATKQYGGYQGSYHNFLATQVRVDEDPTDPTTVTVSTTVSSHTSGLSGVSSSYRAGTETRPINMRVMWIIRVF